MFYCLCGVCCIAAQGEHSNSRIFRDIKPHRLSLFEETGQSAGCDRRMHALIGMAPWVDYDSLKERRLRTRVPYAAWDN